MITTFNRRDWVINSTRLRLQIFSLLLAFSCHASSNNLEQAILNFPKISAWEFRPDEAVQSANMLIAAGSDSACSSLKRVANTKREFPDDEEVNEKVCCLCRLIFVPRHEGELLRRPTIGAPRLLPLESMKQADWPFMPFVIVDNIPLSMTHGYALQGTPEKAESYIEYCKSKGAFRARLFDVPTVTTASNALHQVLVSPAWKKLKWTNSGWDFGEDYATLILWRQIKNLADKKQAGELSHSTREGEENIVSGAKQKRF